MSQDPTSPLAADGRQPPLPDTGQHRFLVFTSAGDRAFLDRWLKGDRDFDLCIAYYGDQPGRYADTCEYYFERKGSKFGNLHHLYLTSPQLLAGYEAVLVMDDDILISARQINRLFAIRSELDLWLCQPAFNPLGKISWTITRAEWQCILRYTNFVEMTAPLFRTDKLTDFLDEFDPILTGTGTDWWFMQSLGPDLHERVAVIDAVACINPPDRCKGGQRECDQLDDENARTAAWLRMSEDHNLRRQENREFSRTLKPQPARLVSSALHWPVDCVAALHRKIWQYRAAKKDA